MLTEIDKQKIKENVKKYLESQPEETKIDEILRMGNEKKIEQVLTEKVLTLKNQRTFYNLYFKKPNPLVSYYKVNPFLKNFLLLPYLDKTIISLILSNVIKNSQPRGISSDILLILNQRKDLNFTHYKYLLKLSTLRTELAEAVLLDENLPVKVLDYFCKNFSNYMPRYSTFHCITKRTDLTLKNVKSISSQTKNIEVLKALKVNGEAFRDITLPYSLLCRVDENFIKETLVKENVDLETFNVLSDKSSLSFKELIFLSKELAEDAK